MGLIILHNSGVIYSNQTGGFACHYPEVEGVFALLTGNYSEQQKQLSKHFTSKKWRGNCGDGIDEEAADFIDSILEEYPCSEILRVDRCKLADLHEAWVFVDILTGRGDVAMQPVYGFAGEKGVLTWSNSK